MRYFLILAACPLFTFAQPAATDQQVLQALLSEVQQLRTAIERSTLLGARTQISIGQLQLQESRAAKLSQEFAEAREANAQLSTEKTKIAEVVKDIEGKRSLLANPQQQNFEGELRHLKNRLEDISTQQQRKAAREGELGSLLHAAERDVADSRSRIAEVERMLDAAIQQMLKPR